MSRSRRGLATSLLVLCMMIGSLNWLAPVAAQGEGSPESVATTEPAATSTTAPSTEIPLPTETEVPASTETPIATETPVPAPTETVEPVVTPTDVPEEDFQAAEPVWQTVVRFVVCEDSARVGETEFQFNGEVTAANNALECAPPASQFPGGVQVTLTPLAGGPNIVFDFGADDFDFEGGFAPGDYSVAASAAAYSASMSSPINLPDDSITTLNIYFFVAATPPDPAPGEGEGRLEGNLAYCVDPARAGETDFFISDTFAADAVQCENYLQTGQDTMTLTQVSGADPLGPSRFLLRTDRLISTKYRLEPTHWPTAQPAMSRPRSTWTPCGLPTQWPESSITSPPSLSHILSLSSRSTSAATPSGPVKSITS